MRGFYSPETTWAILACLAGTFVSAQNAPPQPPIWNSTKDVASFERVETQRLERAKKAIAAVVIMSVGSNPVFEPLHSDGRFQGLLRRIGLASN